jgi:sporulation protein YlmC with PRC-barrel domain
VISETNDLLINKGENLMDIPMDVHVICDSKICGRSTQLVINPVNEQVTHLVVSENVFPNVERLVPIKYLVETSQDWIKLSCSPAEFASLEPFIETDFIGLGKDGVSMPFVGPYVFWPYGLYEALPMPLEHKRIPVGEVSIHRGTPVIATDGEVGKVNEFLISPTNDYISHLVLTEGHFWDQKKDVTIPVEKIDKITTEAVYLKLDKQSIKALPAIPVQRKW